MSEEKSPNQTYSRLSRFKNWISLSGLVLAVSALFAFFLLFSMEMFETHSNPYVGILAYVVAPAFLFMGFAIILLGYILESRKSSKGHPELASNFVLHVDLSRKRDRNMLIIFVGGSLGFLFLTALGSFQTYSLTEENSFCGQVCHVPMEPQFVAYEHNTHAKVDCVACHVGSGATNYIRTKISGMRQLYHMVLNDFNRPVKLHDASQRPSQETCRSCHWSKKHTGNLQKTYRHFLSDEKNTPYTVQMLLKVGGSDPTHGPVEGIHSHMILSNKIEYIATDERHLKIPWVRVTDPDGKVTEYRTKSFKDDITKFPIQRMDCIDCHNRPAHKYTTPNAAVDQSMEFGRIDPSMPWAKANVVKALVPPYATREEADQKIESSLRADYPNDPRVDAMIAEAKAIYKVNFFPEMKVDWRVHPDNIGHKDTNGCFRCHDGKHLAADGESSIKGSDCNACHIIVAQGAGKELEKVSQKGLVFMHFDDEEKTEPNCNKCHNGEAQE